MMKFKFYSTLTISVSFLVGCGSGGASEGPSEEEIQNAIVVVYDEAIAQALEFGGERALELAPELHSTKKVACTRAESNNGFNCDVEIDSTMPMLGRQSKVGSMRFVEAESGWIAIQE